MKVFLSAGCKNGKSFYAERIAKYLSNKSKSDLYYIATMLQTDDEDYVRIERHKKEREGLGFTTIEMFKNIENITKHGNLGGTFLIDSITALLANEMFLLPDSENINEQAHIKIINQLSSVLSSVQNIVLVSDYIYSDVVEYEKYTDMYRKNLSEIDRSLAKSCDVVIEVTFGNIIVHKGENLCSDIISTF